MKAMPAVEMDRATAALRGRGRCSCRVGALPGLPARIVLTGGPGGGKTAVLEAVGRHFCEHVVVLPEAASILFGGGFPRGTTGPARRAAQRAIFGVQDQLERLALEEGDAGIVLCDRGVLDGGAYWPGSPETFCEEMGTTRAAALARYAAVIHLRTPDERGYDHGNPVRIEPVGDALALDARIAEAWAEHPRRVFIEPEVDFVRKLSRTIEAIEGLLPPCCREHDWRTR